MEPGDRGGELYVICGTTLVLLPWVALWIGRAGWLHPVLSIDVLGLVYLITCPLAFIGAYVVFSLARLRGRVSGRYGVFLTVAVAPLWLLTAVCLLFNLG
jgi:hypothetical protein